MKRKLLWAVLACTVLALIVVSVAQAEVELTPKEELGKMLFFDENLSLGGNQSCATCPRTGDRMDGAG